MKEEKTIFEQIKEMSIDELAEFLYCGAKMDEKENL